jgi:ferric-chelate reductase [NAD(P)H]
MYIIGAHKNGKLNGQIANTVFQVSGEPPTVAVSIHKQNLTHEFIAASRAFSVSILSEQAPMKFIGQFGFKSGRDTNKFQGVNYRIGETGAPIVLDHALSYATGLAQNRGFEVVTAMNDDETGWAWGLPRLLAATPNFRIS